MLKTRILTAAILLPSFLAALFYFQPIFWAALLLILTVTGAREWCKLTQFSVRNTIVFMLLTALFGGELLFVLSEAIQIDPYTPILINIYLLSFVFWILGVPLVMKLTDPIKNPFLLMLIGWLVLLPICLAMYQLRSISPLLLLGIMATIWISDTAAYFSGRAFGKHKLAVTLSPGKTWEGVVGALVVVLIYALIWNYMTVDESLTVFLVPLLLLLTVLGIIGDLFESLMKRHAGVKDSGNILPGHGGILDRIDALTSTLPVAMLAVLVFYSTEL
ncbi:MAG: phosphatidate cytidylyltransferase [Nitrosomonas sp.]|nr:phosphatidate cytidylyltransferase [Nitrosomonas sp.]MDP1951137.1 phosphatidate cytidylyltransferase [Nitrosomonas sp.]